MKRYLLVANERKRRAVSEIMGTLLMVAVTLVAGAAVFGFVNGQAATSESQYGASVAKNVNYLNEHFEVLNLQSPSADCSKNPSGVNYCTVLWVSIYNNGAMNDVLNSVTIENDASVTEAQIGTSSSGPWCVPFPGCTVSPILQTTTISTGPTVLPTVFAITLPTTLGSCTSALCFVVGSHYTVQVLGQYGYVVTQQVTVNG